MGDGKKGRAIDSEATAIKLLGMALEKIEREMLWEMGGQIGGLNPTAEISVHGQGMMGASVTLVFDMEKLNCFLQGKEEK